MNVALTADLERLLRKKVEDGQFPDEEAVVQEALRSFLVKDEPRPSTVRPPWGRPLTNGFQAPSSRMTSILVRSRSPRDLPEAASFARLNPVRWPDRFPGE